MVKMVTVYSKPGCAPCKATKRRLQKLRVPFTDVDTSRDAVARERVQELGYTSVPVVEVVGGIWETSHHWQGYRPEKLDNLRKMV